MRDSMFVALVKPIAASVLLVASGSQIPKFDVGQICQAPAAVHWDQETIKNCRAEETAARNDLQSRWSKLPARYREQCAVSDSDVAPSYVELSTCIQTALDLDKDRAAAAHAAAKKQ
jgi:hypothetical protein